MFDHLQRIADDIGVGLREKLAPGIRQSFIQGALLEVDSYWYRCAILEASDYRAALPLLYFTDDFDPVRWAQFMASFVDLKLDWSYRPPQWQEHCDTMGYWLEAYESAEPVVIRVLLRDDAEAAKVNDEKKKSATNDDPVDSDAKFDRKELPREYEGYPIVYEIRPSLIATSAITRFFEQMLPWGGRPTPAKAVSVGRFDPNTVGTAGGKLIDPSSGKTYIVSCAHVLGLNQSQVFSPGAGTGRYVADVRFSSISPLNQANTLCAVDTFPDAGRLDLAVAELFDGESLSTESLDRVKSISDLQRFQNVTFTGRSTGKVDARLNALSIWNEMKTPAFGDGPAGWRCFGGIFELMGRKGDKSQIAASGDSGAWVVDQFGGLKSWIGMLIGKQGTRAYGCFAQHILQAIQGSPQFPEGLILPPQ